MRSFETDSIEILDSSLSNWIGCRDCCGAGSTLLSITANGDVLPCHMFFNREFSKGNALTVSLDQVFSDDTPMFSVHEKSKCHTCNIRYICGGGCLFRSYISRKCFEDTDPLCPMYSSGIRKKLMALIG